MSIYNTHKPAAGEGGGLYLRIKDGETVKLRIASEPAIFESVGEREGQKTISTRYSWLVWNQDTKTAHVFSQSATFFKSIQALAQDEEWGDPTGYDIKVSRQGSSFNDTTYTVTPSANRASLPPDAKEQLAKINLLEKLNASPFAQRVMWLSDWDKQVAQSEGQGYEEEVEGLRAVGDMKRSEASGYEKAKATASKIKGHEDVVAEVDPSEEIDLSDIPF